jgi:hypothetical protein
MPRTLAGMIIIAATPTTTAVAVAPSSQEIETFFEAGTALEAQRVFLLMPSSAVAPDSWNPYAVRHSCVI